MNWFTYRLKKSAIFRLLIFLVVFFLLVTGLRFLTSSVQKKPTVTSVFPSIVSESDVITIIGHNFGSPDSSNGLRLGETFYASNQCLTWEDERITFTIPKNFSTTLLSVTDGSVSSEKIVLTNQREIPQVLLSDISTSQPEITSISRANGGIGQTITIYGSHFGNTRQNSLVLFTESSTGMLYENNMHIEGSVCREENFDYISWSDNEIVVHVPDGASSGNIVVQTALGYSNSVPFTVSTRVGKKTLSNKRTVSLSLSTTLADFKVRLKQNSLFVYMPQPILSYNQQNTTLTSTDSTIFAHFFQGSTIYKFENLTDDSKVAINELLSVETYDVSCKVEPTVVSTSVRLKPEILQFTNATSQYNTDSDAVKSLLTTINGRNTNPYTNARRIFNYIVENFNPINRVSLTERTIESIIDSKTADIYELTLLYCTLARAANIPCIQVSGIAVDDNRNTHIHWWNEFYIDEVGWIPLDIGMEVGVPFKRTGGEVYFGFQDGLHIAFSRDVQQQTQMLSESTCVNKFKSYALRQIWEESSGLQGYNALWAVPKVISVYGNF